MQPTQKAAKLIRDVGFPITETFDLPNNVDYYSYKQPHYWGMDL